MSGSFAQCPSELLAGLKSSSSCRISNKIVALAIWPMAMCLLWLVLCCLRLREAQPLATIVGVVVDVVVVWQS